MEHTKWKHRRSLSSALEEKQKIYTRLRAQHTVWYDTMMWERLRPGLPPHHFTQIEIGPKTVVYDNRVGRAKRRYYEWRKKWVLHIPWRLLLWFFHFNIGVKFAILFHSATFLLRRNVMGSMTERLTIILVLINPIMGSVLRRCTGHTLNQDPLWTKFSAHNTCLINF